VTTIWLTAPWIVRIIAAPEFFDAQEAVGPVAAGTALYALYMVLLVVLGRTGRTEFNFPATLAGVGVNIGLNLLLVPLWGIVGAGVSLVISYAVVLVLMYAFTQRLFPVPYEWLRLAKVIGSAALMISIGVLFVPDDGLAALALRLLLIAAVPVAMVATRFFSREEWEYVKLLARPRELASRIQAARAKEAEAGSKQGLSEVYEVEQMNEDLRN
jgi:O-antigen/teichoic acid export membrane protein